MSLRSEIIKVINQVLAGSKKITELTEVVSTTDDDYIEIVQSGANVKVKKSNLVTGGGGGAEHWRGGYDASGNTYPTTGGSTGGAPQEGDIYYLTVGGTLNGDVWNAGTLLIALTDSPGQTNANWLIKA